MPITAKLSRRFYEALGDEVANELVDWFNAVDATYRADLRELNELNFARFDAKVEQRFVASDLRMEQRFAAFERKFDEGFVGLERNSENRFATMDQRFAMLEQRFDGQELRFDALDSRFEKRFSAVDQRLTSLEVSVERVRTDIVRWTFLFWIGMVATVFVTRLL